MACMTKWTCSRLRFNRIRFRTISKLGRDFNKHLSNSSLIQKLLRKPWKISKSWWCRQKDRTLPSGSRWTILSVQSFRILTRRPKWCSRERTLSTRSWWCPCRPSTKPKKRMACPYIGTTARCSHSTRNSRNSCSTARHSSIPHGASSSSLRSKPSERRPPSKTCSCSGRNNVKLPSVKTWRTSMRNSS